MGRLSGQRPDLFISFIIPIMQSDTPWVRCRRFHSRGQNRDTRDVCYISPSRLGSFSLAQPASRNLIQESSLAGGLAQFRRQVGEREVARGRRGAGQKPEEKTGCHGKDWRTTAETVASVAAALFIVPASSVQDARTTCARALHETTWCVCMCVCV